MATIALSLEQIKVNFEKFVWDFYEDIIGDITSDLKSVVNDQEGINVDDVMSLSKSIKDYHIQREKLLMLIKTSHDLYDVMKLFMKIVDEDQYPFLEQEEILLEAVFGVKVVDEMKVELAI